MDFPVWMIQSLERAGLSPGSLSRRVLAGGFRATIGVDDNGGRLEPVLINDAIRRELAEDARDLAAFEERAGEPALDFEDFVRGLKRDGTL